jgi:isocitrate lyase
MKTPDAPVSAAPKPKKTTSSEAATSAGARLRAALEAERPLQIVGAITAYAARMAQATGFRALYLSGGGVAANSLGMPDLGISTMDDVLIDIRRITEASTLPLLVDADTGWGDAFNIARTVRSFIKAGAAGLLRAETTRSAAERALSRFSHAAVPATDEWPRSARCRLALAHVSIRLPHHLREQTDCRR